MRAAIEQANALQHALFQRGGLDGVAKRMKGTAGAIPSGSKKAIVSFRAKAPLRRGDAQRTTVSKPIMRPKATISSSAAA